MKPEILKEDPEMISSNSVFCFKKRNILIKVSMNCSSQICVSVEENGKFQFIKPEILKEVSRYYCSQPSVPFQKTNYSSQSIYKFQSRNLSFSSRELEILVNETRNYWSQPSVLFQKTIYSSQGIYKFQFPDLSFSSREL